MEQSNLIDLHRKELLYRSNVAAGAIDIPACTWTVVADSQAGHVDHLFKTTFIHTETHVCMHGCILAIKTIKLYEHFTNAHMKRSHKLATVLNTYL